VIVVVFVDVVGANGGQWSWVWAGLWWSGGVVIVSGCNQPGSGCWW
jgi:hypothetical protein